MLSLTLRKPIIPHLTSPCPAMPRQAQPHQIQYVPGEGLEPPRLLRDRFTADCGRRCANLALTGSLPTCPGAQGE
jgi:hypothetical protein